jgi:hypothetical protein
MTVRFGLHLQLLYAVLCVLGKCHYICKVQTINICPPDIGDLSFLLFPRYRWSKLVLFPSHRWSKLLLFPSHRWSTCLLFPRHRWSKLLMFPSHRWSKLVLFPRHRWSKLCQSCLVSLIQKQNFVSNKWHFSGLSFLIAPLVFSNVYLFSLEYFRVIINNSYPLFVMP